MPALRVFLVAALLAPLFVPSTAHACVGGDMYCSEQSPGDPCVTPHGYGRCVQTGCAEAPARICEIKNPVCGNTLLTNPCRDKESGDPCSLGVPDGDGGTSAGTCKEFTCAEADGGTALGCYVPMAPDPSAPGRSSDGGRPSDEGGSSKGAGDEGGCATSPRGGGSSSVFIVALAALGALGRKRRSLLR